MIHLYPGIGRTPAFFGFFDFVKPALGIAAGIFAGPAAGAAVTALLGDGEETVMATGGTGVRPITLEEAKEAQRMGVLGPAAAGAMRKRTIVETIDSRGIVVKRKTTKGGVAVFQQDVTAANRVARQLRRLDKRMPRKIVKQSETARLTEEVKNAALRHARDSADHNGHHVITTTPRC